MWLEVNNFSSWIFYDGFNVVSITGFIKNPDPSFYFGKVYLESYFFEYLVENIDFWQNIAL